MLRDVLNDTAENEGWQVTTLVAVEDDQGRYAEVDGQRVPGTPEQVLADLWEQGWEQLAVWYLDVEHAQETRQVFHQACLRRRSNEG